MILQIVFSRPTVDGSTGDGSGIHLRVATHSLRNPDLYYYYFYYYYYYVFIYCLSNNQWNFKSQPESWHGFKYLPKESSYQYVGSCAIRCLLAHCVMISLWLQYHGYLWHFSSCLNLPFLPNDVVNLLTAFCTCICNIIYWIMAFVPGCLLFPITLMMMMMMMTTTMTATMMVIIQWWRGSK